MRKKILPPYPKAKIMPHASERWEERGDERSLHKLIPKAIYENLLCGGIKSAGHGAYAVPCGRCLFAVCVIEPPYWKVITIKRVPYYSPERAQLLGVG